MWWSKKTPHPPPQSGNAFSNNFSLDELKVLADSEGNIKLDANGQYALTIPAVSRHAFLEKIQRAVAMADLADPSNEPLTRNLLHG